MNLVIEKLKAKVGTFELDCSHLEASSGKILALIGSSGSGKSTLLLAISGFVPINEGSIRLDGIPLEGLPPEKRKMAMVFQSGALFPTMSIFANVEFGLRMQGVPSKIRSEKVNDFLERLEIQDLRVRYPHQISGGQAQRVALARALVVGYPVLLLDEPFSSLDFSLRKELREVLKAQVSKEKIITLLVSHDSEDTAFLGEARAAVENGVVRPLSL